MILLFFVILGTHQWHLNSTLLNESLVGFQIDPVEHGGSTYLTVFGGIDQNTQLYSNSLYIFNVSNGMSYEVYAGGPSARAFSCSGVINDSLYYYGGYDGNQYFNDLWSFSLSSQSWRRVNVDIEPDGRMECGMVNMSDTLIIFGGKKVTGNSTNLHYQINLATNSAIKISFNSHYTTLQNTLWDGTLQNYTSEGIFPNKTSFIQPKNIYLSKISESQSTSLISIVEANETNSVIYILNSQNLLLKQTMYLQMGIDSCQILDVGLFCSEYLQTTEQPVNFVFFRIEDWRKSKPTPQYIQYTQWPTGAYESILFDIENDLMAVVTTFHSVKLYRLPKNQCETNSQTISCFYNKAYCTDNFEGAYCEREACSGSLFFSEPSSFENFTFECGGNGKCEKGKCVCDQFYEGRGCSNYVRSSCGGETTVSYPVSLCTCVEDTIGGNDCMTHFCYNDCSNIGVCNKGVCECTLPHSGPDCSIIAVDIDFSFEDVLRCSALIILISLAL